MPGNSWGSSNSTGLVLFSFPAARRKPVDGWSGQAERPTNPERCTRRLWTRGRSSAASGQHQLPISSRISKSKTEKSGNKNLPRPYWKNSNRCEMNESENTFLQYLQPSTLDEVKTNLLVFAPSDGLKTIKKELSNKTFWPLLLLSWGCFCIRPLLHWPFFCPDQRSGWGGSSPLSVGQRVEHFLCS